jgi:hypothetical protein
MSDRPRLAVLVVLAAAGVGAGAYFLWPSGRHIASCPPVHAPMPKDARRALAAYAKRIRHSVERQPDGQREESWADPLTGHTREVVFRAGRAESALETIRSGRWMRSVWVLYDGHAWMSHRTRVPAGASIGFTAADEAQANRDNIVHGRARIVGRSVVDGRQAVRLHEALAPPTLGLDTLVDSLTYLTLREHFTAGGVVSTTDEDWLPRSTANIAKTRLAIPAGFARLRDQRTYTSSSQTVTLRSRRCA